LLESVDLSVLKLALERLRMSFKNEGAITSAHTYINISMHIN
jgi:hypothetical protein